MKEKEINILILIGEAGMSKTFNTLKYLKENEVNYKYINSYFTPLSFYEILYKNADKDVVVFDDVSSADNSLIISLLKSACWTSDGRRIVRWNSTSEVLTKRELPPEFEFNANVIIISNDKLKGYKPIVNRGIKIDFNFNFKEKLEIFEEIKEEAEIVDEVLDYVKENCNEATHNLSVRSLVILSKLQKKDYPYKKFAVEMLKVDEDIELLRTLNYKEWAETTGLTERTYHRRRKKYGFK